MKFLVALLCSLLALTVAMEMCEQKRRLSAPEAKCSSGMKKFESRLTLHFTWSLTFKGNDHAGSSGSYDADLKA